MTKATGDCGCDAAAGAAAPVPPTDPEAEPIVRATRTALLNRAVRVLRAGESQSQDASASCVIAGEATKAVAWPRLVAGESSFAMTPSPGEWTTARLEEALALPGLADTGSDGSLGAGNFGSGHRAAPLGLANVQAGAESAVPRLTLFGTDDQQLQDAALLGARLLRQVAGRELTWDALVGINVAIPLDPQAVSDALLGPPDQRDKNVTDLSEWLTKVHSNGLRVVLRCVLGCDTRYVHPDDGSENLEQKMHVAEPILLNWENHSSVRYPTVLDLRDAYQRDYLGYMAEGVANLLVQVADIITVEVLEQTVAGLEVFSGIEDRNILFSGSTAEGRASKSAQYWALAWWEATRAIWRTLRENNIDLPFWLPGMTGYYETKIRDTDTDSRNSANWRLSFLDEFLQAAARLIDLTASSLPARPTLAKFASAMNYTWDFRSGAGAHGQVEEELFVVRHPLDFPPYEEPPAATKTIGTRHIANMIVDLRRVREVLAGAGLGGTEVHILDTGVSVTDEDDERPVWLSDREEFQAREVWRRLLGALAAGATTAGWNAWMSRYSTEFATGDDDTEVEEDPGGRKIEGYGMGLRSDDWDALANATHAVPRPSWYAYERLAYLLRGYVGVTLLSPMPAPDEDVYDPRDFTDYLLFFRGSVVRLGSRRFLYFVLWDSTYPYTGGVCLDIDWSASAGAVFEIVSSAPTTTTSSGSGDELPTPSATYETSSTTALPTTRMVFPHRGPLILETDAKLSFKVRPCGAIDSGPEDPFDGLPRIYPTDTGIYVDAAGKRMGARG